MNLMTDRTLFRAALLLALTTWLLYGATATGSLSIDPNTRFTVGENLLRYGDVALGAESRLTVEHEGRHYAVFFPGQSVVLLPVAGLGVLGKAIGLGDGVALSGSRFVASVFYIPAFGALAVLGHVLLLGRLGVGPRIAVASGAVLAFGTSLWIWATNGSEETVLAAVGVWAFVALLDADRLRERGETSRVVDRLGLAAWLLAVGLIHRMTFGSVVIAAVIVGGPIVLRCRGLIAARALRFGGWCLLALATLAIVPLYNQARFGDPLDNGYAAFYEPFGGIFASPLHEGVTGLLFSPGESVFLYVPWLLLVPVALVAARRRLGRFGVAIAAAIALHLVVYGLHTFWNGAFGWGVRFHVSLMPLLLVPIAVWIDTMGPGRAGRAALGALAALSLAVQVAGKTLNMGLEHAQHPEHHTGQERYEGLLPAATAWDWGDSQWRLRMINVYDKLRGRELLAVPPDDPASIRTVWNLFPLRANVVIGGKILWGLWLVFGVLVAAGCVAALSTFRRWRNL